MDYLDLADYLFIAGAVLGIEPKVLAKAARLTLAESALAAPAAEFGGVEFYPDFHTKVAVLGWHLIRNHPLPDGNKRAGFLSMIEFAERNGFVWIPPQADEKTQGDETAGIIEGVAAGHVSADELSQWVEQRLRKPRS